MQPLELIVAEKESWMSAPKDNNPNSRILFHLLEKAAQLPDQLPVHQVPGRMVDGHKADLLLHADMEMLIPLITHAPACLACSCVLFDLFLVRSSYDSGRTPSPKG